jgi:hypothetical protein
VNFDLRPELLNIWERGQKPNFDFNHNHPAKIRFARLVEEALKGGAGKV